jgi:hypothetical protein
MSLACCLLRLPVVAHAASKVFNFIFVLRPFVFCALFIFGVLDAVGAVGSLRTRTPIINKQVYAHTA